MDGPRDYHTEWSRTERQISWYCLRVGFPGGTSGKELICQCRRHKRGGFDPWVRKIPCRRIPACPSSLSITNCWSLLKLMPIKSVMPSSHLILCCPLLLLPPIPPSIRSFPMSQLFAWGGQSIGVSASASVLPRNTQDLSPSGWTGWICSPPIKSDHLPVQLEKAMRDKRFWKENILHPWRSVEDFQQAFQNRKRVVVEWLLNPEGWDGEGGGRGDQNEEHM